MKTISTFIIAIFLIGISPATTIAQCTPGDETSCPDPENNGEVCPAVLPNGIIGKEYKQKQKWESRIK